MLDRSSRSGSSDYTLFSAYHDAQLGDADGKVKAEKIVERQTSGHRPELARVSHGLKVAG